MVTRELLKRTPKIFVGERTIFSAPPTRIRAAAATREATLPHPMEAPPRTSTTPPTDTEMAPHSSTIPCPDSAIMRLDKLNFRSRAFPRKIEKSIPPEFVLSLKFFNIQLLSFLDNLQSTLRTSGFNESSVSEVMQAMQVKM